MGRTVAQQVSLRTFFITPVMALKLSERVSVALGVALVPATVYLKRTLGASDNQEVLFPGNAKPVKFESSAELMDLLAESKRVSESITWKVTQFALARPLVATDAGIVDRIHESAQKGGGTYASLITAIVMSDLVQMTRTIPSDADP